MGIKRVFILLFTVVLAVSLCACGKGKGEAVYCVELQTVTGSGYHWNCDGFDDSIVSVNKEEQETDSNVFGSLYETAFTFVPLRQGTTTATFTGKQSWSDMICYYQTCELTVDAENKITGELSEEIVEMNLGDEDYEVSTTDSSVVTWSKDDETEIYTIRPVEAGSATLTFTCEGSHPGERMEHIFHVTVFDKTSLIVTGDNSLQGSSTYETMKELEQAIGFSMAFPENEIKPTELRSVGAMGYISFQWYGKPCAYVGGSLDADVFFQNANQTLVEGIPVGLPVGQWTLAGWEKYGVVYYLTCDETMPDKQLTELLYKIISFN